MGYQIHPLTCLLSDTNNICCVTLPVQGTVLKKYNPSEVVCYELLMRDPLRSVVPRYYGVTSVEEDQYTEMQCCLHTFTAPNICDVKMGVRTFLEGETSVTKPRNDLYLKMVKEDPEAPTMTEKAEKAITKFRYLDWRDRVSSTRSLGFRFGVCVVRKFLFLFCLELRP